jgi:hypothetical protein
MSIARKIKECKFQPAGPAGQMDSHQGNRIWLCPDVTDLPYVSQLRGYQSLMA